MFDSLLLLPCSYYLRPKPSTDISQVVHTDCKVKKGMHHFQCINNADKVRRDSIQAIHVQHGFKWLQLLGIQKITRYLFIKHITVTSRFFTFPVHHFIPFLQAFIFLR